ncbi:MAG: hypothetical protein KGD63_06240 [Candidatus Lokiarchaeota archaeon]|nr:hypothetical protein [Candidatus Lokiarchaeota archaeon]
MTNRQIIDWLLEGDPSIKWQVLRDLQNKEEITYNKERQRVITFGWGADLLSRQDNNGLWNGELYNGKWISTTYTLYLLKIFGLPPGNEQALKACNQLFIQGLYEDQEIRFSRNQKNQDLGLSGFMLSILCYFGYRTEKIHNIAAYLIEKQCKEGNWLPNENSSALNYTFETTLIILEGFLQYQKTYPSQKSKINDYVLKGQNFLS